MEKMKQSKNTDTPIAAKKKIRSRTMMYMQQVSRTHCSTAAELVQYMEKHLNPAPIRCSAIIHNKDEKNDGTLVEPHFHCVLQFKNSRYIDAVAKELNTDPQYLEKWKGDSNNAYSYLIHLTNDAQNKYQYPISEVFANFDYGQLMEDIKSQIKHFTSTKDEIIIKKTLDDVYSGKVTLEEVEAKLTGSQYAKAKTRLDNVYQKHLEKEAEKWRVNMREQGKSINTIWIFGDSGVGKTRLAKDYAISHDETIFISGSSRDPFQHYKGQRIIILDELRPTTFQYSDLLKILDPFNSDTMGASRYFDKPLTADTFIITTPYSPKKFYSKVVERDKDLDWRDDTFKQLARRIDLVLVLNKKNLAVAFYDTKEDNFFIDDSTKEPNPYTQTTISEPKVMYEKAEKQYKQILDVVKQKSDSKLQMETIKKYNKKKKSVPPSPAKANKDTLGN